ncbi:UreF-domain-containing protein [Roridomyces roridus]|uniref:UreF-domain-containing protein n=1 Tax=Roridomyces roridus TaxID=1738132 RepID=A0AAD7C556_9AGAR|nr:UreF-domain-containing protein [Roridomyces roridus]
MDNRERDLLLLLSDSNLPTGSFVASSGLESFLAHGFATGTTPASEVITTFVRDSLSTYAPSALPFVADAHSVVSHLSSAGQDQTIARLEDLDDLYECMTLNHVARRASKAQGVALLSLYAKGFSRPPGVALISSSATDEEERLSKLVDNFKLMVRRGDSDGHLPVCWGTLCAALGLSLERTQHLHLYLHARSLLSAAVRLNSIGPYAAQQILHHAVSSLVDQSIQKSAHLRTGVLQESGWDETTDGPANTWPLGEILAARHDLQHSRIFNS